MAGGADSTNIIRSRSRSRSSSNNNTIINNNTISNSDSPDSIDDSPSPGSGAQADAAPTHRQALVVACVATNALTAGSMFCFPLIGPSLMADFHLDLKQTNALWSAAVLGEYLSAGAWGALADVCGPAPLSLAACLLFGTGYGMMARRTTGSSPSPSPLPSQPATLPLGISPTVWLGTCFALVGAGVGASYFGSMTAATRIWPSHPGRALALPLTLFSLSSMFLTSIGERFFVDPATGDLDSVRFFTFLAILLGVCNGTGAYGYLFTRPLDDKQAKQAHGQGVRHQRHQERIAAAVAAQQARQPAARGPSSLSALPKNAKAGPEETREASEANESTPLVSGTGTPGHSGYSAAHPAPSLDEPAFSATRAPLRPPPLTAWETIESEADIEQQETASSGWSIRSSTSMLTPRSETLSAFAQAPSVWILAIILVTAVGAGEMVMSNAGSMVVALYPIPRVPPPLQLQAVDAISGLGERQIGSRAGSAADVPGLARDELRWRSRAVALFAVTNTISRLVAGIVADALRPAKQEAAPAEEEEEEEVTLDGTRWDPSAEHLATPSSAVAGASTPASVSVDASVGRQRRDGMAWLASLRISRVTLLMSVTFLLSLSFVYASLFLSSLPAMMAFVALVGFLYGSTFTLVPSIIASAFGLATFGRSWGLLSYACALGSFAFPMLYAAVSDTVALHALGPANRQVAQPLHDDEPSPTCRAGRGCFSLTFMVAAITTGAGTCLLSVLRSRWNRYL